ncbi:MAG: serine/threonine-protein kinase [Pseudomonadota bacterium]
MTSHVHALQAGQVLVGDYRIERVLGAGGFGITYLANEIALDRLVTIKEYFPSDFAARIDETNACPKSQACSEDYSWGLTRFIDEAKALARFDHPNIVRVFRYFRANETAYMVLSFEEGQQLRTWHRDLGRAPNQADIDSILGPLLDALEVLHAADLLHRDIAPDNIIVRKDGSPVLIDFGSARGDVACQSRAVSALVKPGYSPYEQYGSDGSVQGPWTDIYALAATLYHIVTGNRPPDSPSRIVSDAFAPAIETADGTFRREFLSAIDAALHSDISRRPQSVRIWRAMLFSRAPIPSTSRSLEQNLVSALGTAPAETERLPHAAPAAAPTIFRRARQNAAARKEPGETTKPNSIFGAFFGRRQATADPVAARTSGAGSEAKKPFAEAKTSAVKPTPVPQPPRVPPETVGGAIGGKIAEAVAEPVAEPIRFPSLPKLQMPQLMPHRAPVLANAENLPVRAPARPPARRRRGFRTARFGMRVAASVAVASGAVYLQQTLPYTAVPSRAITTSSISPTSYVAHQFSAHPGRADFARFAYGGRWVVTAGDDNALKVWNAVRGTHIRTLQMEHGPVTALAVTKRTAVTGHEHGDIAIWDLEDGKRIGHLKRNGARIWSLAVLDNDLTIAAAAHDWTVTLWSRDEPDAPQHVFGGHESAVQAVAYAPERREIFSAGADKSVKVWDRRRFSEVRSFRAHKDYVTELAVAPDGKRIASGDLKGEIRIWSATKRRSIRRLRGHKGEITGLSFLGDGDLLASSSVDGRVRIWSVRRGRRVMTLGSEGTKVRDLGVNSDGTRVVTAEDDGRVRIWDVSSAKRG